MNLRIMALTALMMVGMGSQVAQGTEMRLGGKTSQVVETVKLAVKVGAAIGAGYKVGKFVYNWKNKETANERFEYNAGLIRAEAERQLREDTLSGRLQTAVADTAWSRVLQLTPEQEEAARKHQKEQEQERNRKVATAATQNALTTEQLQAQIAKEAVGAGLGGGFLATVITFAGLEAFMPQLGIW